MCYSPCMTDQWVETGKTLKFQHHQGLTSSSSHTSTSESHIPLELQKETMEGDSLCVCVCVCTGDVYEWCVFLWVGVTGSGYASAVCVWALAVPHWHRTLLLLEVEQAPLLFIEQAHPVPGAQQLPDHCKLVVILTNSVLGLLPSPNLIIQCAANVLQLYVLLIILMLHITRVVGGARLLKRYKSFI